MPRAPRLDAPDVLHHVMARGLERQRIFRDDHDREDFMRRLAALAESGALTVYAWVLLPNHFHLLLRTGQRPLSRSMRSLLTGYAGMFNRRYRRSGHLFQNRYKSVVCEDEPYFLELVRYLHLNPLRAKLVEDFSELDAYTYSGHSALLGRQEYPWQDTTTVLKYFARRMRLARQEYRAFVAEGAKQGSRPDLQGGGLIRSAGGWAAVQELRRGREGYVGDERILGGTEFVERIRHEVEERKPQEQRQPEITLDGVVKRVCQAVGVRVEEVAGSGRRAAVSRARAGVAYLWLEWLGHSGPAAARVLGLRPQTIYEAARRGQQEAVHWQRVLAAPSQSE